MSKRNDREDKAGKRSAPRDGRQARWEAWPNRFAKRVAMTSGRPVRCPSRDSYEAIAIAGPV